MGELQSHELTIFDLILPTTNDDGDVTKRNSKLCPRLFSAVPNLKVISVGSPSYPVD